MLRKRNISLKSRKIVRPTHHKKLSLKDILSTANEYIGLITLAVTFLVGYMKVCRYAFEKGVCTFWKIDPYYIDISDNSFYGLLFYIAIAIIILFLNALFYLIYKAENSIPKKLLLLLLLFVATGVGVATVFFIPIIQNSQQDLFQILFNPEIAKIMVSTSALLALLFLIGGVALILADLITKKLFKQIQSTNHGLNNGKFSINTFTFTISGVFIGMSIAVILFYHFGDSFTETTKDTKTYRIIQDKENKDNKSVVLYENDNLFFIANYVITEDKETNDTILNISKSTRTMISKEGITTILTSFDKVDLNNLPDLEDVESATS